MLVCW